MKLSRQIRFGLGVGCTFFFTMTPMAGANPTGAEVTAGGAAFDTAGSALNITTATDRTIINWNSFSIGTGQITNFIQPNASSAVLNRVIGSIPSEIAGQLVSNGRVGLLNPNGILITQSGSINTNGFTASTLNLSDADFMGSGMLTFKGDSEAVVSNSGTILARQGDVFLIGRTVANSGTIEARDGNVALAAGSEITLQKAGDGRMSVTVPASSKKGSVNHSGTIKAVQQQLRDNGGNPYVLGMNVDSSAEMTPQDFMNAQVAINAGRGKAEVSGSVAAGTQAKGGEVRVEGGEVAVKAGARLDVSGDRSGGTIQVGGGFQGQDKSIGNSRTTTVESGSTFTADSRVAGDGGRVILWSDGATTFSGSISAQGGANGGNGGFAEVSGKQWLGFGGLADLGAVRGATGTLLLDPTDIILNGAGVDAAPTFGAFGAGDPSVFDGGANNASTISIGTGAGDVNPTLLKQLASANVVISTTSAGGGTGNITVNGPISYTGGNGLTLNAGNNLTLNFAITNAGTGALNLVAANTIALNAGLSTLGAVSLSHGGALTRTAGTVTAATLNLTGAGAVTTGVGADVLTTNVANIVLNKAAGNSFIVETDGVDISGTTGGGVDLTAVGNLTQAGALLVTGATTLAAGTGNITLANTGNDFATVTIASGNVVNLVDSNALVLGDVTAAFLTTHSGTSGAGDTTFAVGSTISADSQSYRAGNGLGGGATAKVITSAGTFGDTAGTDSPVTFIHWQDAAIADADTTSLSKFVGTVPGAYTLRSDEASITITDAGKIAGSNLILNAATALTISDSPTVASLDATAGTTIILPANVTSTGTQIYRNSLTLGVDTELQGTTVTTEDVVIGAGNDLKITGNAVFGNAGADTLTGLGTLEVTGISTINASTVTTTAGQTYGGTVTLGAGTTLTGTTLALAAGGIAGAGNDLTVDFSTAITLPGNIAGVGNFTSQQAVNVNGSFTTSGSQTYNAAVTLTGDSTLTGTALTLASGITGGGNNLTLDFSTPFVLPGTIAGVDDFISEKAIQINGSFTTTGSQRYKGAVETGLASTLAGSSVRFDGKLSVAGDSTVGSLSIAGSLILAPSSTLYVTLNGTAAGTFDQIVVTGAGSDVTVTNATLDGEVLAAYDVGQKVTIIDKPAGNVIGEFVSGDTVSINGQSFAIDYKDGSSKDISLTRSISTWTWDGGGGNPNWSTSQNWNKPHGHPGDGDIVVFDQKDDATQVNDLVGLDLDTIIFKAGADAFNLSGLGVNLTNGIVNNSNNLQTVTLPITLAGNQAFNTTGTGALVLGAVSGTVDLTLSGSNLITLGGVTTLNSLIANSPTGLGAGPVTTSAVGGQVYNGAVTLTANTVLDAGAGAITFAGTVNGGFSLDANTTGITTFGGAVGNSTALTSLVTNAGGSTVIGGGLIRTSAAAGQVFNDGVTLGADAVLDAGAGAVTFADTLNGLFGLTVNTTGTTTFGTVVGGTDRLTHLTTDAGGTVVFNGNLVRTSGPQSYGDAVVTGLAMTLDAGAGNITAVNVLNDFPLTLTLTGGTVQVTDASALTLGTLATGSLTVNASGLLNLGTGTVSGALLASSGGNPINQAAGGLTVTGISTVNAGVGTITLTDPNNDFQGAVSLTGAAAQIVDKNALRFGTGNVASLAATAGGSVDQTGALTVTGVTTVDVTAPGSDILLHTAANDFGGAVSVIGTQTNVRDFGIRNINAGATIPALTGLTNLRNLFIEFNNIGVTLPVINASGNATIISGGVITDTGDINVGGTASFTGTAVNLGAGLFNVGTLTFNSAGNVTISEDSAMNLVGSSTAGTATLTSTAGISDAGATSVDVAAMVLNAPAITLGGGIFNAGTLNFNSAGAVVIAEDSGMDLVGINTAGSAALSSTGLLSDAGATSVTVTGLGSFSGGSITLGGGIFNVGTLTFNSAGNVTISEDSAIDLTGVNTGGLTSLTSTVGISDAGATSVDVGALVVNAPTIALGGGIFNAGTLNFNSVGAVVIAEDSGMDLVGINTAVSATLSSTGLLSDAGTTSVTVTGLGSFSGGSINLGGGIFNVGTLTFNSAGNVTISEDSALDLVGVNTAGSAALSSTGLLSDAGATSVTIAGLGSFSGTAVDLGGGIFNVGTLTFNSAGNVTISEDSAMDLTGVNTGGLTTLASTAGISDAGATSVDVGALVVNAPTITLGGGIFNAGTLNFNSAGVVVIAEDSGMDLVGVNTAASAALSSTGLLSDAGATSVTITGLGSFSGGSITLGGGLFNVGTLTFNSAGNVTISEDSAMDLTGVNTGGLTTLTSTAGISDAGATSVDVGALVVNAPTITLGGGIFNAGTLNFNSAGAVVIAEDSGMDLVGINTAASATLSATGLLSDAGATSVTVTGLGSFSGGSITLGGGIFNVGTLTFNSAGNVTINEDSAMDLTGVNTGGLTTLTSTVGISDAGATSVDVGALVVNAPTITLGGGIFNAGTLNFNSAGAVVIAEDSGMDLVGINTAASAALSSTGLLSDAGATSVTITGLGSFSGGSISLGGGVFNVGTLTFNSAGNVTISEDSAMDLVGVNTAGSAALSSTGLLSDAGTTSVTVTGLGSFNGGAISLGGGIFNVGTLTFNSAGNVTISEDSAMDLVGVNTGALTTLASTVGISDAGATSVDVGALVVNAPTITLGGGIFNAGTLNFNSAGAVVIAEDSGMDIVGINTAGSAALSAVGVLSDAGAASVTITGLGNFSGSMITLGGGLFNVGTLTFNSPGNVSITEDSDTELAGSSTAGDLQLASLGSIGDATGTGLVVTNGSVMTAGGPITLNDTAGDVLTVGANARFSGSALTIGPAGSANFGSLTFNSAGLVEVQEDSNMDLVGVNSANRLVLGSAGAITDGAGTTLVVTTDAAISATGPVTLANTAGDILAVGANASFAGSAVNVGTAGAANFGTLTFNSTGNVVVLESSGMLVSGTGQAGTLRLESSAGAAGTIGMAGTADPGGPATVTAGGPITLLASGGIDHFAGSSITTSGTFDSETAVGNITMADGASITAGQDIRLVAPGNITLGSLTTAGNVRITAAGDIIDAQADTVGHDTRSFATLIGTRTVNITGAGAYLDAGGRIGGTDDNPLDVNVATLATKSSGDTAILASGDISLRQVSTTVQRLDLASLPTPITESSSATMAAQSAAGDVRIETIAGSLSADLSAFARQDLLLLANGTGSNLMLNSNLTADDDIGLRAANSVTSGAINIHATGATAVVPNGGTIDIEAFNGNVNLVAGSVVSTVNGHIRVAAEAVGGIVSVASLTGPDLVVLMGDGDVNAAAVTGIGLYAESRTGNINLTTHVDEFAARAPGTITIHELDGLSIGLTGGDRKVDRVRLDNSATEVSALVSLGSGIGIDSSAGGLNLTTGGTLSQTAIIRVNHGLVTLDSGAANDIRLTLPNELSRLTVTNALNVAIKDIDSGDADGPNFGLMLEGAANTFTGTGFAVATEGGMRFVPGTRITGPANSKVVLIAGSAEGMPGINEISGNKQPAEDESLVNLDPDLDVANSDIYLIGNSLQSNSAPKGGYIRLVHGVPTDPIRNLRFNFSLAPAGPQSADGILNDAINGGTFGGAATFGMLAGLTGDTAALFSGAPVIDLSVSDASELARSLLKKGVAKTNLMGNVNSLIDRGAVAPPGVSFVYFGPFWTIGYDYDQYVNKLGDLPPPLFPLYYYFDQNGKPVYLLNLPASSDASQPVTPQ